MSTPPDADRLLTTPVVRWGRTDVVILPAYLLLAIALGFLSLESSLRAPAWAIMLLGLAGVTTVLVRPRHPGAAFTAMLVLLPLTAAVGSMAEAFLVLPALYRAGVTRSARQAWACFGLTSVVAVIAALVLALRTRLGPPLLGLAPRAAVEDWPLDWFSLTLLFLAFTLITALLGINIGHRRRHIAALVERAEQMKRERDQQASIAAALERERIAREMHDVIAHSLSVMIALADGAEASASQHPEESQRAIGRVAETGRRTLGEVRRLLGPVRGLEGSGQSSLPATLGVEELPALVEEFRAAGLPVRLECRGELDPGAVIGLTIYRIVQESLTNVLRHAREVRGVLVRILIGADEVTILVEDTSAPALPATDPGRGLVGIRERAAFYDGHVTAGPRAGGGWRVAVRLPAENR
ncbi:histidine kinase [Brachybacterium paraconglomeratum]|uniref:sensor histidine kinase n=1 Tax=Brachybacterium paraconglomeratum TaxID=173362 RepID=UPI0031E775C6